MHLFPHALNFFWIWNSGIFFFFNLKIFYLASWCLSFGMWGLVPWPGIKPGPPALGAQSLSHWITREVPGLLQLWLVASFFLVYFSIFWFCHSPKSYTVTPSGQPFGYSRPAVLNSGQILESLGGLIHLCWILGVYIFKHTSSDLYIKRRNAQHL